MKSLFLFTIVSLLTLGSSLNAQQSLIAGWDFSTAPGTDLDDFNNDQGNMPQSFTANFGSGTLYADGTNGSSLWRREGELTPVTGDNENNLPRQLRITSSDFAGRALAFAQPRQAQNREADSQGESIVFAFSMEDYASVDITYAFRRSSKDTFKELIWETSTNATDWIQHQTLLYPDEDQVNWTLEDRLNTITGLAGASTAYIRVTFDDASNNPGGDRNFQIDNIQFNATPIPEPAHIGAIFGVIILAGAAWKRRKNRR